MRDVNYVYDMLNRLERSIDSKTPDMDEFFAYDAQGRIVQQLRGTKADVPEKNVDAGVYSYYENTNRLRNVSNGMGRSADNRSMSSEDNFVYDADGNLIVDKYLQG